MAAAASRYAGPVGVVTSALTADTQPTSGPVADQARQQQRAREAAFITQQSPSAPSTASYATKFRDQVNREAGYEVIKGGTTAELIDSISKYQGAK